jgi:hypothetical protein
MTLNGKTQNKTVVDLVGIYNFYIKIIFIQYRKKDIFFLRYILTISKHIFFVKLNENNFYSKIVDLDEIYNFLVLSFFI